MCLEQNVLVYYYIEYIYSYNQIVICFYQATVSSALNSHSWRVGFAALGAGSTECSTLLWPPRGSRCGSAFLLTIATILFKRAGKHIF